MGDLEPLGVNIGPIYAQNLGLKNSTVTQKKLQLHSLQLPKKFYSYRKKFTVTEKFLQLLVGVCINPNLKCT